MAFVKWVHPKKHPFIIVNGKRNTVYLSPVLREKIGSDMVDIYIDNENKMIGLCRGSQRTIKNGQFGMVSLVEWSGVSRKRRILMKYDADNGLYVGKL